jgi:hypothetical protein
MTPLHSTLKRALSIDGRDYVLTLSQTALKLTLKGKRNGVELPWSQLVNGEAALAVTLHASLGAFAKKDKAAKSTAITESTAAAASAAAKLAAAAEPAHAARTTRDVKTAQGVKPKRRGKPARKK